MTARDPSTQYQAGEPVLHAPSGILTNITGYVWAESIGSPPLLLAYRLACGISATEQDIKKLVPKPDLNP